MITTLYGTKGGLVQKNVEGTYKWTAEIYTEEGGNLYTKVLDQATVYAPPPTTNSSPAFSKKRPPSATGRGWGEGDEDPGLYKGAATGKNGFRG